MMGYGTPAPTPSATPTPTPQVSATTATATPPPALPVTGSPLGWLAVALGLALLVTGVAICCIAIRRQVCRRFEAE